MSTGSAFITVNKNGDNSIVVVAGANAALSEKDIEENIRLIEECDILVLQWKFLSQQFFTQQKERRN